MIETRVRVLSAEKGRAWVEATEHNGCSACSVQSSCSISGLGRFFSRHRAPIAITCGSAKSGQEMTVAVAESDLLRVALWAYILPVLMGVCGAALFNSRGDLASVLGMAAGVGLGLLIARRFARHPDISITSGETP